MAWGQRTAHCCKLSGLNNHSCKNSASAGLCGGYNRPGETDCRKQVERPSWITNYLTVVCPGESVCSCVFIASKSELWLVLRSFNFICTPFIFTNPNAVINLRSNTYLSSQSGEDFTACAGKKNDLISFSSEAYNRFMDKWFAISVVEKQPRASVWSETRCGIAPFDLQDVLNKFSIIRRERLRLAASVTKSKFESVTWQDGVQFSLTWHEANKPPE